MCDDKPGSFLCRTCTIGTSYNMYYQYCYAKEHVLWTEPELKLHAMALCVVEGGGGAPFSFHYLKI